MNREAPLEMKKRIKETKGAQRTEAEVERAKNPGIWDYMQSLEAALLLMT